MKRRRSVLVLFAISAGAALGQQQADLTSMSLEDLLNVEVVSVRKSSQKLSRTPASVFVITQSDIRRSGATTLPEALRLAPGIHVARLNGAAWAIGMRGFNTLNSDKLLVMVDGRTIYNPVLTGVIWSTQTVALEDVERIEVIRGPAGAMWGANAVTGVINVITFKASATQGTLLSATAGTFDAARSTVRYGAKHGDHLSWRTWFHQETNGQARVDGMARLAPWNTGRTGTRVDWSPNDSNQFTLESEVMGMRTDWQLTRLSLPPAIRKPQVEDGGAWSGYVLGQWTHVNRRGDQSKLQVYEDIRSTNMGFARFGEKTLDFDLQHSIALRGGHNLLVGGGLRSNQVTSAGTTDLWFEPASRNYFISNFFMQDEWELIADKLVLTLGAKLEHYTRAGAAFQPNIRLMWTPSTRQGYWIATAWAVRAPSHLDYSLRYPLASPDGSLTLLFSGNEQSRPERLRSVEIGARWQLWRRAYVDVSSFYSTFSQLHAFQFASPLDPESMASLVSQGATQVRGTLLNAREARSRGGELLTHYDLSRRWRLLAGYSGAFVATSLRPGLDPARMQDFDRYYPQHMLQFRSSWEIGTWSMDAAIYRNGKLSAPEGPILPAYTRADFRVEKKVGERLSVFLSGRNLLGQHHQEFYGDVLFLGGIIGRNVSLGVRWEP